MGPWFLGSINLGPWRTVSLAKPAFTWGWWHESQIGESDASIQPRDHLEVEAESQLINVAEYHQRNYEQSESIDESTDKDLIRIQFRHRNEKIWYSGPAALYEKVMDAIPEACHGMWKLYNKEFPSAGGFSGYGGPFHQTLSLNDDPIEAKMALGQVSKGYGVARYIALAMNEPGNSEKLNAATGGVPVVFLYWPAAFYTAYPWGVDPSDPEAFFPNEGPYFGTRYNVNSERDHRDFSDVFFRQRQRLEKEIDAAEAAKRIERLGKTGLSC